MTIMNSAIITPGMKPPANSLPIDVLACTP